jgi:hypothetical protein
MSRVDQFKLDFEDWAYRMKLMGEDSEAGIEEIRAQIREDWNDPEKRDYWMWRAEEEAKHTKALRALASGSVEAIRQAAKEAAK